MLHNNYTNEEYRSYHVILPGDPDSGHGELLLGDLNAATDSKLMEQHQVKTIITAATGLEHLKIPAEQTHIVFPLLDLKTENIQAYFELSNQSIEESNISLIRSQAWFSSSSLRSRYIQSNIAPNLVCNSSYRLLHEKVQDCICSSHQACSQLQTQHMSEPWFRTATKTLSRTTRSRHREKVAQAITVRTK